MPLKSGAASPARDLSLLTLIALAAGCAMRVGDEQVGELSQAVTVCPAGAVVQGVDVSVYQGTIDWPAVKASGVDFAIARISDGASIDTLFAANWSAMASAGLVRGAYQYFEPTDDPTTQADIVVSAVGMLGAGDLPVTADMEMPSGQSAATIVANLQMWATAVEKGTGKTPMIYTAEDYWDSSIGGSTAFGADPLWVANWGQPCPVLPIGWSDWVFWQYSDLGNTSDEGSVPGITGVVDLDQYNGTLAQLQAFAGSASPAAPHYAAKSVDQSWPLASATLTMTTCEILPASITLENVGTTAWDGSTRLATTQPRDRTSVFSDSTWVSTDRPAQVTGTVAPGQSFTFKFDFHAPPTAGTYDEFFGVVEDGVAWFSDPGQGGPPDNDIQAKIQVVVGSNKSCATDPGLDAGPTDAGTTGDGGDARPRDGSSDGFSGGDSEEASFHASAGCACTAGASGNAATWWAAVVGAAAATVCRRRPKTAGSHEPLAAR